MPRQAGSCRSCRTLCPLPMPRWCRVAQPWQCQAVRAHALRGAGCVRRAQYTWRGRRQRRPTQASRACTRQQPSTQRPSLRAARHAVARRALASMAHLAPARLRFGAVAVGFEHVQTSVARSNRLSPRPCASAPPTPQPAPRPAPACGPCRRSLGRRLVLTEGCGRVGAAQCRAWRQLQTQSEHGARVGHTACEAQCLTGASGMNTQLVAEGHNPSIERTTQGKPWVAAHVER